MVNILQKALALTQTGKHEFGGEFHQPVSIAAFVTPTDHQLQVNYQGLLKNAGAKEVYLHYGEDGWAQTATVKMDHNPSGGFTALIQPRSRAVEFCFKDNAENWDNNNGSNWRAQVSLE